MVKRRAESARRRLSGGVERSNYREVVKSTCTIPAYLSSSARII